MNKRTLIVGNWKMNLSVGQSSLLVHRLSERIKAHRDIEVVLAPSMLSLQPISVELDRRKFRLASQDAYHKDEGGYTGEVSFAMVQQLVHYGIVGHSSRRIYFNETLEVVRDKVAAAVRNGVTPILCIGETKEERKNGETRQVLHDQLTTAFQHLTADEVRETVVAYEPVWAISAFGGEIAKPDVVAKELAYIRLQVRELYGEQVATDMRVLYGGSVDEHDARSYLALNDCDGVLVGAASLNYVKFSGIVEAPTGCTGNAPKDRDMADKTDKPDSTTAAKTDKPAIKRHPRKTMAGNRSFDIKPAGSTPADATSRPVVTDSKPTTADSTLRRHGAGISPLTPITAPVVTSVPTTPAAAPVAKAPAVTPAPTTIAPMAPVAATPTTATPATPVATTAPTSPPAAGPIPVFMVPPPTAGIPVATPVPGPQPPVPDVNAPPSMLADHEQDELELASLTGLHGIVDKSAATPQNPCAPAPVAAPVKKEMHQTPEQAKKLAAALKDLKPMSGKSDKPIVVVHQHDYLRTIAVFLGFAIGGLLFVLVIIDLVLDAGLLDLGIKPLTNFF